MSSDQVLLGRIAKSLPRTRAHSRYVALLLQCLKDNVARRGGRLPRICVEEELREFDRVVVEGESCWNCEMAQVVMKKFPGVDIEQKSEGRVEIYVPVVGVPPVFAWKDFTASLSVAVVCAYLLYLYVF